MKNVFRPQTFNHIFLMGPPGSGKTTIGKLLGNFFRRKVIDIDNDILEPAWGNKVSDMVTKYDRADFLRLEADEFMRALPTFPSHSVVSLSGSNPLHPSFLEAKIQNRCVLLDATADVVESRMIDRGRIAGLENGLSSLFEERREAYEEGHDIKVSVLPDQDPFLLAARVAAAVIESDKSSTDTCE